MKVAGSTALVTGANRGLGLAFAKVLALGILYRRLSTVPVVTIAKVAGRVRGAGNEFTLACDMCFASHEPLSSAKWKPGLACFRAPEACNTLHGS